MKQSAQDQSASDLDVIDNKIQFFCFIINSRKNIQHLWLSTSKIKKELKAKNVRSISTWTAANELGILVELTSLRTFNLNSTRKEKFTNFNNRKATASWQRKLPIVKALAALIGFIWKQEKQIVKECETIKKERNYYKSK